MPPTIASLHIYPLKSCAPLAVNDAKVEKRGLAQDRRWLVTDAECRFLTARQHPRLTLIRAITAEGSLQLSAPGMPQLNLPVPSSAGQRENVIIWKSEVAALASDRRADDWISRFLGSTARLFHMDDACVRGVDPAYAQPGDEVSFADGFPLLLMSQSALDDLNARLRMPVPMLRFRPNLVVDGSEAYAEDAWKRIRVGDIEFDVVKRCIRCVITTVDFERGAFDPEGEPLRTLIGYRRTEDGVSFGQNLIPRGSGRLKIGDRVEVLA